MFFKLMTPSWYLDNMTIFNKLSLPFHVIFWLFLITGFGSCSVVVAEVRMGVTSQVEYNDNILLEETGEMSDVMYRVSPWIDIKGQRPRLQSLLSYHPSYTWYETNREYDLAGHRVEMDVAGNVSRNFDLSFDNRYELSEEGASERQDLQGTTRLPYSNISSILSGTWVLGKDEIAGFSFAGEMLDYDKASTSQDSSEAEGRINLRKKVKEHVFGTLESGYAEGWYDDSTSYQLANGTLGSEYALNPKKRVFGRLGFSHLTGDARVNYSSLNPFVGVAREFPSGHYDIGAGVLIRDQEGFDTTYHFSVVGNAEIKKSWRRGEMTAAMATGHDEEYIDSANPGFDTFVSGTVSGWYAMAKNWKINGACELRDDSYLDNRPGEDDRNDVTLRLTSGVEYQLLKRATLRLDYKFNARRSNMDEYEYDENSIILTLNCFTK